MSLKRKAVNAPSTPGKRKKISDAQLQGMLGVSACTLDGTDFTRDEFIRANEIMTKRKSYQDDEYAAYSTSRIKQRLMWNILKDTAQETAQISSQAELASAVEVHFVSSAKH